MKRSFLTLAVVLTALLTGHALARAAASYSSSLSGRQATHRVSGRAAISTQSSGDLPGPFTVNVEYNPADNIITGGSWELRVVRSENGSDSEVGTLEGTVTGGSVTFDADGWVSSVNCQLTIVSGTASYAGVTNGSGSVEGSVNQQNTAPFSGTLNLNF